MKTLSESKAREKDEELLAGVYLSNRFLLLFE